MGNVDSDLNFDSIEKIKDFEPYFFNKFKCSEAVESTGFNKLMVLVLQTQQFPELNEYIKDFVNRNRYQLNQKNSKGWTALMLACRNYNTRTNKETIEILIDLGANLDEQNNQGWTALMMVARYSSLDQKHEIVELLIQKRANLNLKNNDGYTALMLACKFYHLDSDEETVIKLINSGTDLNIQNNRQQTALMVIIIFSNMSENIIKTLIDKKADLNKVDSDNNNALMLCLTSKHTTYNTLKLLIDGGSDLTLINKQNKSLLMLASKSSIEVTKLILSKEPKITLDDLSLLRSLVPNNIFKLLINYYCEEKEKTVIRSQYQKNIKENISWFQTQILHDPSSKHTALNKYKFMYDCNKDIKTIYNLLNEQNKDLVDIYGITSIEILEDIFINFG